MSSEIKSKNNSLIRSNIMSFCSEEMEIEVDKDDYEKLKNENLNNLNVSQLKSHNQNNNYNESFMIMSFVDLDNIKNHNQEFEEML